MNTLDFPMKQNIYDNPAFFDAYMEFRRTDAGFNGLLEEPAMISLLPDLRGKRVLDIGCGTGRLCRYLATHGASCVLGIDPSERMLSVARSESIGLQKHVEYHKTFVEDFDAPLESRDLVVSSLALHYVEDLKGVLQKVFGWLSPMGKLIFSVEHPVYMAAASESWLRSRNGRMCWAMTDYFTEGRRVVHWLGHSVVKHHRTLQSIVSALVGAGFSIETIAEPQLVRPMEPLCADLIQENSRPVFLFVGAVKYAWRNDV
jgi:2-polyprenyl-3-methyl-5-hydroxy-6-metoxy-1,4-benzoquinol methylase